MATDKKAAISRIFTDVVDVSLLLTLSEFDEPSKRGATTTIRRHDDDAWHWDGKGGGTTAR